MSMSIPQTFVTNLDKFTWSKDWRATRIIKERRTNGDYYFANIMRYYGIENETHDYDIGDTIAETAWLGRNEIFVGSRVFDKDENSPTFGKRIYTQPVTEIIEEENDQGKPLKREVLVKGKTIYEYTIKVTPENTKKMKTLAGAIGLNQNTQLLFVYGPVPPYAVDPDTFWDYSVSDYLKSIQPNLKKSKKKNDNDG